MVPTSRLSINLFTLFFFYHCITIFCIAYEVFIILKITFFNALMQKDQSCNLFFFSVHFNIKKKKKNPNSKLKMNYETNYKVDWTL